VTEYPILKNAPIIEALIDIRVKLDPSFEVGKILSIYDKIKDNYPEKQKQQISQVIFGIEEKNQEKSSITKINGFRFISEDKKQILQARLDGFTFSRLKPYKSWDELKKEAKKLWDLYKKTAKPLAITRVAVRYINNLNIQMPIKNFGDYLTAPPTVPDKLPQGVSSFLTRIVIQEPDIKADAIITQSLEQIITDKAPIMLDIDVFKYNPNGIDEKDAWEILEKLRNFKNKIFFESITKKFKETFV